MTRGAFLEGTSPPSSGAAPAWSHTGGWGVLQDHPRTLPSLSWRKMWLEHKRLWRGHQALWLWSITVLWQYKPWQNLKGRAQEISCPASAVFWWSGIQLCKWDEGIKYFPSLRDPLLLSTGFISISVSPESLCPRSGRWSPPTHRALQGPAAGAGGHCWTAQKRVEAARRDVSGSRWQKNRQTQPWMDDLHASRFYFSPEKPAFPHSSLWSPSSPLWSRGGSTGAPAPSSQWTSILSRPILQCSASARSWLDLYEHKLSSLGSPEGPEHGHPVGTVRRETLGNRSKGPWLEQAVSVFHFLIGSI